MARLILFLLTAFLQLGAQNFAGAAGGISTLSADGATTGSPPAAFSLYKPDNGAAAAIFAGRHFSDWLSAQAGYGWNRNSVVMSAGSAAAAYDFPARAGMHTVVAELMVYFRRRNERLRPYLSVGTGFTHLRAASSGAPSIAGAIALPPPEFSATGACLRVAVGMDVLVRGGFALRYTFAETIQKNAISARLTPPGSRNLANFQNLWGAMWRF